MLQAKHCSRTLLPPHIHPLSGEEVTQGGEKEKKGGRFCEKQVLKGKDPLLYRGSRVFCYPLV